MHPKFVKGYPELLSEIKRKNPVPKQSTLAQSNNSLMCNSQPTSKDLTAVFEELRQLRERQKNMETKMNELIKLIFLIKFFELSKGFYKSFN